MSLVPCLQPRARLETGGAQVEVGGGTRGWRQETGDRRLETRGWRLQPSLLNPLTRPLSCWLYESPKPSTKLCSCLKRLVSRPQGAVHKQKTPKKYITKKHQ